MNRINISFNNNMKIINNIRKTFFQVGIGGGVDVVFSSVFMGGVVDVVVKKSILS